MWRRPIVSFLMPWLAAGRLPSPLASVVHRWLREDVELATLYHALRRCELARGVPAPLSAGQRDLLESLVLAAATHERRATSGAAAGVAGVLAVASVLAFAVLPQRPADPGEHAFPIGDLAARGERLKQDALGVKVTCLGERDGAPSALGSATGGARHSGDTLPCPRGSLLAFSTTNLGSQPRHVFVVGIGADGAPRWYAPFSRDAAARVVPAGQVDAALPVLADTSTMPDDAAVTLFVLMSDQAFTASSVERQIASSSRRAVPLKHLERLPLVDIPLQARIDLLAGP
jgi:hypothetical protein